MATVQLNAQDFEKTITDNNLVFVDFWATWCGPCRAFGPTFEAASEENPDIVFGKVDIDANQDLASAAGIQAVPTLMIAKQGQIIFKQAGALRAEDLDDLIAQAKALDVSAAAQDSAASAESPTIPGGFRGRAPWRPCEGATGAGGMRNPPAPRFHKIVIVV